MRLSQLSEAMVPLQVGALAARFLKTMAVGGTDEDSRLSWLSRQKLWHNRGTLAAEITKAAVSASTTDDAPGLTSAVGSDFAEYLMPGTIIGRLPGVRRAPLRTRLILGSAGGSAAWVSQGAPIPFSLLDFDAIGSLSPLKIAGAAAITLELAEFSRPDGETLVLADLARAVARTLDTTLIDPSNTGSGGLRPASLTAGGAVFSSTGATPAAIAADSKLLMTAVGNGDSDLQNAAWIMRPATAAHIATLRDSAGGPAFPGVGLRGGNLFGLPIFITTSAINDTSPAEGLIALIDGSEVLLGDDGSTLLDASREGSAQMDSAPSAGAANQISFWQNNLVGLRAIRYLDWRLRRASASAVLTDVSY